MKALSLQQPYASLVSENLKRIETRSWGTQYRGLVAIHASQSFPAEYRELCLSDQHIFRALRVDMNVPPSLAHQQLPRGFVVAVAELTDCRRMNSIGTEGKDWHLYLDDKDAALGIRDIDISDQEHAFGHYFPGRFAWTLSNIAALPEPVACRGALSLWRVPEDVAAQIIAQLERRPP